MRQSQHALPVSLQTAGYPLCPHPFSPIATYPITEANHASYPAKITLFCHFNFFIHEAAKFALVFLVPVVIKSLITKQSYNRWIRRTSMDRLKCNLTLPYEIKGLNSGLSFWVKTYENGVWNVSIRHYHATPCNLISHQHIHQKISVKYVAKLLNALNAFFLCTPVYVKVCTIEIC